MSADGPAPPELKPSHLRAEQARLMHRIESLEAHRLGLERAVEPFGGDCLDAVKWRRAFDSTEPDDVVARNGLTGCYSALVNGYVELLKSGAYLGGLTPRKKERAKDAIDLTHEDGGISEAQAELLHTLYVLEGRVEHASPDITAEEIREAVEALRAECPALIANAVRWLGEDGLKVLPV
jgi:hypothetical protein